MFPRVRSRARVVDCDCSLARGSPTADDARSPARRAPPEPSVTRPRAIRRPISVLRLLAGAAVVLGFLGSGSQAGWSDNWSQLFLSTFQGVADGAISGTSVPAETGKLTLVPPSGRSVSDVAPKTGIYSERLGPTGPCGAGAHGVARGLPP